MAGRVPIAQDVSPLRHAADLWDIEQIKMLKARYCRLVDTKQWDAWGALLTVDCVFTPAVRDASMISGREAIVAWVANVFSTGLSVHIAALPEIILTGDGHATGTWAMSDYIDMPYAHKRSYGHYHETYVRSADSGWQISSIKQTRLRTDKLTDRSSQHTS